MYVQVITFSKIYEKPIIRSHNRQTHTENKKWAQKKHCHYFPFRQQVIINFFKLIVSQGEVMQTQVYAYACLKDHLSTFWVMRQLSPISLDYSIQSYWVEEEERSLRRMTVEGFKAVQRLSSNSSIHVFLVIRGSPQRNYKLLTFCIN